MKTCFEYPVLGRHRRWCIRALLAATLAFSWVLASARDPPAFLFEPMLDTYFDDRSGLIVFHAAGYDLAFPADEPLNAVVAVVDDTDTVVASFPFQDRYGNRTRNGVIARVGVEGMAEVKLTELASTTSCSWSTASRSAGLRWCWSDSRSATTRSSAKPFIATTGCGRYTRISPTTPGKARTARS